MFFKLFALDVKYMSFLIYQYNKHIDLQENQENLGYQAAQKNFKQNKCLMLY